MIDTLPIDTRDAFIRIGTKLRIINASKLEGWSCLLRLLANAAKMVNNLRSRGCYEAVVASMRVVGHVRSSSREMPEK